MPFPPPTDGYVDRTIAETLDEYLVPKKSAIHAINAKEDLKLKSIEKGDVITIEIGRNPHNGCIGYIELNGDTFLAVLHWHRGRWFAQTDERKGAVTEDMQLIGVARSLIKNQIQD